MTHTDMSNDAIARLAAALPAAGQMMATAESCTGGWIAKLCTDRAGSSAWFERGLVTYSNRAKSELLGVPAALIETHGAVSEAVARAMAEGARERSAVAHAVAVTGIAGPDGGSQDKPVGTVWFAWAGPGGVDSECHVFPGDREAVRQATCAVALRGLAERVEAGLGVR
jgi:nicotinamide-nucleotide amidase